MPATIRFLVLVVAIHVVSLHTGAVPVQAAPDVLVVCPAKFRAELAPWVAYRGSQGHELVVVEPAATSRELHTQIRNAAKNAPLRFVVLVGDVADVPTCYAEAKVNILWGSEPTIATDQLYGDVDGAGGEGDGVPDLAVGRIPVDSSAELAAFVRKVLRYEQQPEGGSWRQQIDVVAGVGGFGVMTDALIEAAARNVFRQVVPPNYSVRQLKTDPEQTCAQISAGSFAWIYLGHGLPTMLDVANTPRGPRPILSVGDVPQLRCGAKSPLAVLVACYTGAIDARDDSLAEKLVLNEQGPVAAIAATRVTMPYGNTVLGCELLRAALAKPRRHARRSLARGSTADGGRLAGRRFAANVARFAGPRRESAAGGSRGGAARACALVSVARRSADALELPSGSCASNGSHGRGADGRSVAIADRTDGSPPQETKKPRARCFGVPGACDILLIGRRRVGWCDSRRYDVLLRTSSAKAGE